MNFIFIFFYLFIISTDSLWIPFIDLNKPSETNVNKFEHDFNQSLNEKILEDPEDGTRTESAATVLSELQELANSPDEHIKRYAAGEVENVDKLEHDFNQSLKKKILEDANAESGATVLSKLQELANSRDEQTKRYAAEKVEELLSIMEQEPDKNTWFTLNNIKLLVNIGRKGSKLRSLYVQRTRSLLEWLSDAIISFCAFLKGLFWTEKSSSEDQKNIDLPQINTPPSQKQEQTMHQSVTGQKEEKQKSVQTEEKEKLPAQNESKTTTESSDLSTSHDSEQEKIVTEGDRQFICKGDVCVPVKRPGNTTNHKTDTYFIKTLKNVDYEPFKTISDDDKEKIRQEVARAREQIVAITQEVKEIEERKQPNNEDTKHLKELKEKIQFKKEFIKLST